jgi:hypothetical protein
LLHGLILCGRALGDGLEFLNLVPGLIELLPQLGDGQLLAPVVILYV